MSTDSKETQNKQCNIPVVGRSAITYEQFQEALKIVNEYKTQLEEHYKIAKKEIEGISKFANVTKETLTTITLVKFRDFVPVTVQGGVGNVNSITQTGTQPRPILCTVNGAIVDCLDNNLNQIFKI